MRALLLVASHLIVAVLGFGAGIYLLPILTAPDAPSATELQRAAEGARFAGSFRRDLPGSDPLHWGEGRLTLSPSAIVLQGRVAPGPDYKLYLSPRFVDNGADFLKFRSRMLRVGDVKTFENFVVPLPPGTDLAAYDTAIVWCETFSMFISAAKYR